MLITHFHDCRKVINLKKHHGQGKNSQDITGFRSLNTESLKQLSNSSLLKKIAAKSGTNIKRRVGTAKDMMRERNPCLVRG